MPVYFTTTTSDLMTAGGFGFATWHSTRLWTFREYHNK
jgi:hypothetical protein